jgi:sn-1 stearoyl-lipid 9-desaturase
MGRNAPGSPSERQNADKEGDPHSPRDGGLWAHVGWIITGKAQHNSAGELLPFVPDLRKDKFYVWISKCIGFHRLC